ncbi:MAG: O-antigen ligase family protein [Clostridia bacterium]|nr:O-antigen ligase family protein [Clostridia bacterium]
MKINVRNILTYIFCFIILMYPFNYTIKAVVFPNNSVAIGMLLISFIGLLLLGNIKKITKYHFIIFIVTLVVLWMQLYNNYYLKVNNEGKVLLFSIYLFLPLILCLNKFALNSCFTVIRFFCFEHIVGTFFVQFFKDFYIEKLLPWLSNGVDNVAYRNILNGYNPGLTMHYSTNGIYLTVSTIYFFSKYIKNKNRKDLIFVILSLIALLLTGKRAHTLFTLASCVALYIFYNRENFSKKIIKFLSLGGAGCLGLFIISTFMPQILNVLIRFEKTINAGELLSGREPFYELAINMWKEHKLFGYGWGAFGYYFQQNIFSEEFVYGYLDAHNVYLQLLCECGIVGLIFLLIIAVRFLLKTINAIKIKTNVQLKDECLLFTLAFQIFFLLYCFSGNPLYDIQCYSIYFICLGKVLSYQYELLLKK